MNYALLLSVLLFGSICSVQLDAAAVDFHQKTDSAHILCQESIMAVMWHRLAQLELLVKLHTYIHSYQIQPCDKTLQVVGTGSPYGPCVRRFWNPRWSVWHHWHKSWVLKWCTKPNWVNTHITWIHTECYSTVASVIFWSVAHVIGHVMLGCNSSEVELL